LISACVIGVPPSKLKVTLPVGRRTPELTVTVTVPVAPDAIAGAVINIDVGAGFTVKVPVPELAPKLPCAAYDALKVWLGTLGLLIVKAAEPLLSDCDNGCPLSTVKDTVPVTAPDSELTVTVTRPFPLYVAAGALIVVVVGTWFTVCERTDDVDVAKFVSPP